MKMEKTLLNIVILGLILGLIITFSLLVIDKSKKLELEKIIYRNEKLIDELIKDNSNLTTHYLECYQEKLNIEHQNKSCIILNEGDVLIVSNNSTKICSEDFEIKQLDNKKVK